MRRFLLLPLFTLFFVAFLPLSAPADDLGITQEDALERARKIFPAVSGKEDDVEIQLIQDSNGHSQWSLFWSDPVTESYMEIEISAEDGSLTYCNLNLPKKTFSVPKRLLSRKEAETIAYSFAKEQHPEKMISAVLNNHYLTKDPALNRKYSFAWEGTLGGIPVADNFIAVDVDAATGKVTGFLCNWRKTPQVTPQNILNIDEFSRLAVDRLGAYPFYLAVPSPEGVKGILGFITDSANKYFDASTGTPLDDDGSEITWEEARVFSDLMPQRRQSQEIALSGFGRGISAAEGEKIAGAFFEKMGLQGIMKETGISRKVWYGKSEEYWNYILDQTVEEGEPWSLISLAIKAANGRIATYYRDYFHVDEAGIVPQEKISFEKALQVARDFLALIGINEQGDYILLPQKAVDYEGKQDVYRFMWSRLINGVPSDDCIGIEVSGIYGEVTIFNESFCPFSSFASPEGTISGEKAQELLKQARPFELAYIWPSSSEESGQPKLVYQVDSAKNSISAHSGTVIDPWGWVEDAEAYEKNLQNHWGKAPLSLLSETGLLPLPEALKPNATVKRREGLRIMEMVTAKDFPKQEDTSPFTDVSQSDPDLLPIIHATKNHIIEPGGKLHPNAPLNREDLAVWIVNAMGYKEVAEAPVSMNVKSKDASKISKKKRNHVALAQAYRLMNNDGNGNFRPQDPVTWGELATVVMNAFPKLDINYEMGL